LYESETPSEGSISTLLVNEFTADPGLQYPNIFELFGGNSKHIPVNDNEIRKLAGFK